MNCKPYLRDEHDDVSPAETPAHELERYGAFSGVNVTQGATDAHSSSLTYCPGFLPMS